MHSGGCLFILVLHIFLLQPTHLQLLLDQCGCTEISLCPPNSNTTMEGAVSVEDCVCYPGFVRVDGGCLETIDCPVNSKPIGGGVAVSLDDCMCDVGFIHSEVDSGLCLEVFYCPPNSNSTVKWALSPEDCVCDTGYARLFVNGSCDPVLLNLESSTPPGLPIALIAGVSAGGAVALVAGGWVIYQYAVVKSAVVAVSAAVPAVVPPPLVAGLRGHMVVLNDPASFVFQIPNAPKPPGGSVVQGRYNEYYV